MDVALIIISRKKHECKMNNFMQCAIDGERDFKD